MNIKQNTLAALLVLGIGMSGCNNDNNSTPSTDNKAVDQNNTEENVTATILGYIGSQHSDHNSTITVAQLQEITPALSNIDDRYLNIYQRYIASADTNISSPATVDEVQSMIDEVNDFNLPEHAILDRSFFTKTNGAFEHRFVYLAVENNTTGKTWLNNNLGADYANVDSSNYNASQQATATDDKLAYGSLFQWGRKADGHELINWNVREGKYTTTTTKSDAPDKLFILDTSDRKDWRVTRDDTLWASESSPNNVCPIGYRLPRNPNGANDAENEFYQLTKDWKELRVPAAFSSFLKLTATGIRAHDTGSTNSIYYIHVGNYWSGSVNSDGVAVNLYFGNFSGSANDNTMLRAQGLPVRCIKD